MKDLVRWSKVKKEQLCRVEDPFFSTSIIREYLKSMRYVQKIHGVSDLLRECGLYDPLNLDSIQIDRVLSRVASGEWMLIRNEAFKPIDLEGNWYAKMCSNRFDTDRLLNTISTTMGPGKWKIVDIRVNKFASSAAFVANFLASRGDEGRIFLSSGKDFANTTRTVTQRWVPLGNEERDFTSSSAIHRYGEEHKITQIYVEADDAWDISGSSWHWRPVVADEEYEFKGK
ncbi:hypothetical protein [Pseudomonas sp. CC120222-01a]|uniref:hypothetical protein n=1 Tax=Pseudomonas sp. CC120222-01a TaxID=1378075 RepID=UPI000D97F045|nr:hypothetical protein [Pseudomonas sp. CC120222-01a]PVZ43205.1 hypothetical protein N430_00894 [Pseudomonas sp. CC120222-01a]